MLQSTCSIYLGLKSNKNLKKGGKTVDENKIPLGAEDEAIDADAIMAEFDRESNVRIFTGWRKTVITALMSLFSVYMISMALVFQNATK